MRPNMLRSAVMLAIVLSAACASAQFAPSIALSAEDVEGTTSIDRSFSTMLTIENTGEGTGTDLDPETEIVLSTGGAPPGWTVSIQPSSVILRPGHSETATVTVAVGPGTEADEASITITARGRVGVSGPLVQEGSDDVTLEISRSDAITRDALEVLGPFIWVLLAGLLLAGATAALLLYQRSRVPVALEADRPRIEVTAGSRAAAAVKVRNLSHEEYVILQVADPPEGWAAFLPTPELRLAAGAAESLQLIVIAPGNAKKGEEFVCEVKASAAGNPEKPALLRIQVVVA